MALDLPVVSSEVPENLECHISNSVWQELIALLHVNVTDGFKWIIQSTTPDPADRIWPWFRLNGDGPIRPYIYFGGAWLARHTDFPGKVILWEGLEANIESLDENTDVAGTAVTNTTGPFWEKVSEMDGKIPVGPGQLDAGPPVVSAAINVNAGAYSVQLGDQHYRHHKHFVVARQSVTSGSLPSTNNQVADDGGGNAQENYLLQGTGTQASRGLTSNVNGDTDANEAFPILPQVRGIFFLRRTARLFYRV